MLLLGAVCYVAGLDHGAMPVPTVLRAGGMRWSVKQPAHGSLGSACPQPMSGLVATELEGQRSSGSNMSSTLCVGLTRVIKES